MSGPSASWAAPSRAARARFRSRGAPISRGLEDGAAVLHSLVLLVGGTLAVCLELPLLSFLSGAPVQLDASHAAFFSAKPSVAVSTPDFGMAGNGTVVLHGSVFQVGWTYGQGMLFAASLMYHVLDVLLILSTRSRKDLVRSRRDVSNLLRHIVCTLGLMGPLLRRKDGTIVLCALLLIEVSNPARVVSQFLSRRLRRRRGGSSSESMSSSWSTSSSSSDVRRGGAVAPALVRGVGRLEEMLNAKLDDLNFHKRTIRGAEGAHLVVFFVTRLACAHYIAHVVVPFAELWSTMCCVLLVVILSFWSLYDFATARRNRSSRLV